MDNTDYCTQPPLLPASNLCSNIHSTLPASTKRTIKIKCSQKNCTGCMLGKLYFPHKREMTWYKREEGCCCYHSSFSCCFFCWTVTWRLHRLHMVTKAREVRDLVSDTGKLLNQWQQPLVVEVRHLTVPLVLIYNVLYCLQDKIKAFFFFMCWIFHGYFLYIVSSFLDTSPM